MKTMKTHIYPKFLLKKWLLKNLGRCNKKLFINKVDMENKKLEPFSLENKYSINKFLKKDDFFYLELDEELIKKHEEKWGKIESKFANLCDEIQSIKKNTSTIPNSIFESEKNLRVIWEFFALNRLRSEIFYRPIGKIVNSSNNTTSFEHKSSIISNIALETEQWNLDELFDEIENKYSDFNFYIRIDSNLNFFCNPPLFFNPGRFFIFPILTIGFLIGIKKNYLLLVDCNDNQMLDIKMIKNEEKIDLDSNNYKLEFCFFVNKKIIANKEWLNKLLMELMMYFWINNVGYKTGDIYYLHPDKVDKDLWEKHVLTFLENNEIFKKRKEYLKNLDKEDATIEIFEDK